MYPLDPSSSLSDWDSGTELDSNTETPGTAAAHPLVADEEAKTVFMVLLDNLRNLVSEETLRKYELDTANPGFYERACARSFTAEKLALFLKQEDLYVTERYGSSFVNVEWLALASGYDYCRRASHVPRRKHARVLDYPFEVIDWSRSLGETSVFSYIVSRYLGPVLKRKILLSASGKAQTYNPDGAFHVLIHSSPEKAAQAETIPPKKIYGVHVESRIEAFQPETFFLHGVTLSDGEYCVGKLFPNALYICHDAARYDSTLEYALMAEICKRAARLLCNPARFQTLCAASQKEFVKKQKELFLSMTEWRLRAHDRRCNASMAHLREEANKAREAFVSAERAVIAARLATTPDKDAIQERFGKEIDALNNDRSGLIENGSFALAEKGAIIRITTRPIIAFDRHTEKYHLRGRYLLVLNFHSARIKFFNLDNTDDRADAHITASPQDVDYGEACLGNIEEEMTDYLAHFQPYSAITLAIAFLQSPDSNDTAGRCIREYPVVPAPNKSDTSKKEEVAP